MASFSKSEVSLEDKPVSRAYAESEGRRVKREARPKGGVSAHIRYTTKKGRNHGGKDCHKVAGMRCCMRACRHDDGRGPDAQRGHGRGGRPEGQGHRCHGGAFPRGCDARRRHAAPDHPERPVPVEHHVAQGRQARLHRERLPHLHPGCDPGNGHASPRAVEPLQRRRDHQVLLHVPLQGPVLPGQHARHP